MELKKPRKPRRKDAVLKVSPCGDFITAKYELNGEVVIGMFKRFGWAWGPRAQREELQGILNSPPLVSYSSAGSRAARG